MKAMINWIRRLFEKPQTKKPVFRFKDGKFVSSYVIYDESFNPGVVAQYAAVWEHANNRPSLLSCLGEIGSQKLLMEQRTRQRLYNYSMSYMIDNAEINNTTSSKSDIR